MEDVTVEGQVQFQREVSNGYLYTVEDSGDRLFVYSDTEMEQGHRTLKGDVKELDGTTYLRL
jgi:hypothetical protein